MGDAKAARRDGPGRPAQPVQRQADVRGGHRGRRRARADPPRPRPLGAALARARDRGDRRRPPARGDRLRSRSSSRKGDTTVEVDEAPRRDASLERARQAAGPELEGGLAHRRQLARASTTAPARSCSPPRSGREANAQGGPRHDHRPGAGRRRLRLPRPHARQRGASSRSTRPACSRATSTCGRSTRRSPPSTLNSIRMLGIDEDKRQRQRRRGRHRPPDRRLGRAHHRARSCTSCGGAAAATAARRSAPAAARATPSSSRCDASPASCQRRPGAAPCAAPTSRAPRSSTSTAR